MNPTAALLEAPSFVAAHDRIFALLLLLNANMGALELGREAESKDENPHELLHGLARVYQMIDGDARERVRRIVKESGALPVARDTPSFAAVLQMLNDGASAAQLEYVRGSPGARSPLAPSSDDDGETAEPEYSTRAEAKADSLRRQRDAKEAKPRSLLGDLPSLERRRPEVEDDDESVALRRAGAGGGRARQSDDVRPNSAAPSTGTSSRSPRGRRRVWFLSGPP